ncbi:damage-inducible protein CinA [Rhodobacter veldkampii DSM 11550]|uniref:Damage-inducible protein CinA n=1 Tax=Phaeovulum veldkampii DSM 11550 TaxID=1185920 RepID=A0A2T4JM18_9RHOB|nr:CinA family protein [Phaeovulum veldkampii]MBK5945954.1 damage-inducible protein CinA [Phaeovulum veldkampii DSM 11550]PTE18922.1 damage-inducible protein CinA [Phaeovulum veldkampii DSM 11550]TDQ64651.1 nicotinamide-nucleotide amidase [Phaeovulum veldkampii DSM 11550]
METAALLAAARVAGLRIATAESCTGGMIAAALTDPPGASHVFDRGFVTYSNAAKVEMLGVLPATLDAFGAVSEAVAREMAAGALARSGATLAVAVTGIAGPGGSEFKPEGRVCFALARGGSVTSETCDFGALGRDGVRRASLHHALALLAQAVTTGA